MGMFGGSIERYHKGMGGNTGRSAAKKATAAEIKGLEEAMALLEGREKDILAGYDPYVKAGNNAFAEMVSGSTIPGYGKRLDDIRGSEFFGDLKKERYSDASRYLSSQGIGRSTAGAETMGGIDMDTIMGLENMLMGRTGNIAGIGYNALGTQTGYKDAYGRTLADMTRDKGRINASGILSAAEAIIQGQNNRYAAMHNAGSSVMGMFGGGMGGGSDAETKTGIDPSSPYGYSGDYNGAYGYWNQGTFTPDNQGIQGNQYNTYDVMGNPSGNMVA